MQNYKLRIRIYDPINGFIIPGISGYREEEFNCDVKQFVKSDDENEIVFTIELPYNYIVRLKDSYREAYKDDYKNDYNNDYISTKNNHIEEDEEDEEDEEEQNVVDEFGNQLDILSHEVKDFRSDIRDTIDLLADDLEDVKPDREQLEKLKKIRADLEKINLEFGKIL